MTTQLPQSIELFYSYAQTQEDEALRTQLETHLAMLVRTGRITGWHKQNILAGTERPQEIERHLSTAHVILLLISPDFLASDYCYGTEIRRAMERHNAGEARVIPILLRPCYYEGAPFERLSALPTNGKAITTWSNQDEAFAEIAREISKAVAELTPQIVQGPSSVQVQRIWNVPYRRNPFFTGRETLLKQLHDNLTTNKTAALTQAHAISGLGGIGKTQTAVEYAYRYRDEYDSVLWTTAATRDTLVADVAKLADLLRLPERTQADQSTLIAAVKAWLTQHDKWLLILDNADDIALAADFLPTESRGHILLTTRANAVGGLAKSIEVEKMDKQEGILLLLRRAKVLAPDAPLEKAPEPDRSKTEAIVKVLDGLPLALDQAGAYIEETGCSISAYLDRYQRRQAALLQRRGGPGPGVDHPEPVATTWSLSFEQVEKDNTVAAELLCCCAFLAPDAIPEELLVEGASELGPILQPLADDVSLLDEAVAVLRHFSLVRRDSETNTLIIHRLVQAVLKERMNGETQRQWTERVIRALNQVFPRNIGVELKTWPQCRRYLPHVQVCAELLDQHELAFPEAGVLFHQAGVYLQGQGEYEEARHYYQQALAIYEKVLPAEHRDTAATLHVLGALAQAQGEYEQAQGYYQRALAIKEKVLPPEHPSTATTLHELGRLAQAQGEYEQAQGYYQRALAIFEKVLPAEHPDTVATLHELGRLAQAQGEYDQAQAYYQRALAIKEKVLPAEHPSTAITRQALAFLYEIQGKYEEAEALYQQAVAIMEKVLPNHPHTAIVLESYASFLRKTKREGEAAKLERRVRAIRGKRGS